MFTSIRFNTIRSFARTVARRLPLALVFGAAILYLAAGGARYVSLSNVAANARWLHDAVARWGVLAPLLFVVIEAAMLTLLVIPAWLCTVISGLLFGPWLGTICGLAGSTLGAVSVFMMTRSGLTGLGGRAGPRTSALAAGFRANAFGYLLMLRLVPLFPFALVNVAAALTGQPLRSYVLATAIGCLPSVMIYTSLGDLLLDLARHGELPGTGLIWQPRFLLPMLGLALLALLGPLIWSQRNRLRWQRGHEPVK